ncbi:ABC transporter permease, partial [Candidatus Cloacimonadota bacterium]
LIVGILIITFLTGIYPAFIMSSFNTIFILKKAAIKGKSGLRSRRILMLIQFIITISLILGTLIIFNQMKFMINKDLGYDKEHILYFWMDSNLKQHEQTLKEKLLKSTEIKEASIVHSLPGNFRMEWGRDLDNGTGVNFFSVPCDEDYIQLLDMEIVDGRNFNPDIESDQYSFIINETFAKKYNLIDPLSAKIADHNIVGIVKDFTFQSLHNSIKPMAFSYFSDWSWYVAVKVTGSDIEQARETIQTICSEFTDKQMNIRFLDEIIAAKYIKDKQFSTIFTIFSILAILVSSLGLLGLISFEANRRTKEIGIRKVLGASPLEIINLFNKEIIILICTSSVIAWIIGYFWLTSWLQNFAFRIEINSVYFILSTLITAFLALITFSALAYKAASANPVESIKHE